VRFLNQLTMRYSYKLPPTQSTRRKHIKQATKILQDIRRGNFQCILESNWDNVISDANKSVMVDLGIYDALMLAKQVRSAPAIHPPLLVDLLGFANGTSHTSADGSSTSNNSTSNEGISRLVPATVTSPAKCGQDHHEGIINEPSLNIPSPEKHVESVNATGLLLNGPIDFNPPPSSEFIQRSSTPDPPNRQVDYLDGLNLSEEAVPDVADLLREVKTVVPELTKNGMKKILKIFRKRFKELPKSTETLMRHPDLSKLRRAVKRTRLYGIPTNKKSGKKYVSPNKCPQKWAGRPKKFLGEIIHFGLLSGVLGLSPGV
jgi:hypothetical protein